MWKNLVEYNGVEYSEMEYNGKVYILEGRTLYEEISESKVPKWLKACVPGTHQDGYLYSNVYGITCHKFFKEHENIFNYELKNDKYYYLEKENTNFYLTLEKDDAGMYSTDGLGFKSENTISLEEINVIIKEKRYEDVIRLLLKKHNIRFQGYAYAALDNEKVQKILTNLEPERLAGKRVKLTFEEAKQTLLESNKIRFHIYIKNKKNEFW